MSRTIRTVPAWAKRAWGPGSRGPYNRDTEHNFYKTGVGHDINRCRWINGYDGISRTIGSARNDSPNGYDLWDDIAGPRAKRSAKRGVGKIRRRRGMKEASDYLVDES